MANEGVAQVQDPAIGLRSRGDRSIEPLFRGSVAVLGVITVVLVATRFVHGHAVAPAFDLALDTLAVVVSGAVTALAWTRFREWQASIAVFQTAAFFCLTIAYGTAVVISLGRDADPARLADPNPIQEYVFTLSRLLGAGILVLGATPFANRLARRRPRALVVAPAAVLLAISSLATINGWVAPQALWIASADPDGSALPRVTTLGAAIEVVIAVLFFEAAFVCLDRWRRERSIGDGWMAVGLVFAAFAEIHWIIFPAGHPGQVSSADLLRLVFFVALLFGIEAEARTIMSRLRTANVELADLRQADVERASLEERARLARELHDGLAQDLWLAKLRAGQLAALEGLPDPARPLLAETEAAIDTGLSEARQAVMALRLAADREMGFRQLLERQIDEFEDRFGMRVEFTHSGDISALPARTQAEVLRIAQEALTNVRQHADATMVGVRLEIEPGRMELRVVDNGRGFDVAGSGESSFGLSSMRERAELIGGHLQIDSTPGEGTRVVLAAPFVPVSVAVTK